MDVGDISNTFAPHDSPAAGERPTRKIDEETLRLAIAACDLVVEEDVPPEKSHGPEFFDGFDDALDLDAIFEEAFDDMTKEPQTSHVDDECGTGEFDLFELGGTDPYPIDPDPAVFELEELESERESSHVPDAPTAAEERSTLKLVSGWDDLSESAMGTEDVATDADPLSLLRLLEGDENLRGDAARVLDSTAPTIIDATMGGGESPTAVDQPLPPDEAPTLVDATTGTSTANAGLCRPARETIEASEGNIVEAKPMRISTP